MRACYVARGLSEWTRSGSFPFACNTSAWTPVESGLQLHYMYRSKPSQLRQLQQCWRPCDTCKSTSLVLSSSFRPLLLGAALLRVAIVVARGASFGVDRSWDLGIYAAAATLASTCALTGMLLGRGLGFVEKQLAILSNTACAVINNI
jgi:hypothetical protein